MTGRSRVPRDQGSIESANKLIKRVLANIEQADRLAGIKDSNWTDNLGRAMAAINSSEQCGKLSLRGSRHSEP